MRKHTSSFSFLADLQYRRGWKRFSAFMSILVVFATLSSLTLPAITLSLPICGLEEHAHSEECYSVSTGHILACTYRSLGVHEHTKNCRDEEGEYICGYADFLLHTHEAACFNGTHGMLCKLPEIEEHSHGDNCYLTEDVVVDPGHTHSDSCFEMISAQEAVCGIPESEGHSHDAGCYDTEGTLICALEEAEGHIHNDSCYPLVRGELICEEIEREPVVEAGEPQLVCNKEEIKFHEHSEECYEKGALICTRRVVLRHSHSDSCYEPAPPALICSLQEHLHSDACFRAEESTDPSAPTEPSDTTAPSDTTEPSEESEPTGTAGATEPSDPAGTKDPTDPTNPTAPSDPTDPALEPPTEEQAAEAAALDAVIAAFPTPEEVTVLLLISREDPSMISLLGQVEEARARYEAFTDPQKTLVTQLNKLELLEAALAPMALTEEEQLAVDTLNAAIAEFPEPEEAAALVALDKEAPDLVALYVQVKQACRDYDALNTLQQRKITQQEKLLRLEEALAPMALSETEQMDVDMVIDMISKLPSIEEIDAEVSRLKAAGEEEELAAYLDKIRTQVRSAFAFYNMLTNRMKAAVTNADLLDQYYHLQFKEETLTVAGDGYNLTIQCPAEAQIPDNAAVEISGLASDSELYAQHLTLAGEALPEFNVLDARFFDISILSDGEKLQPKAGVTLTITFDTPIPTKVGDYVQLLHFGPNGTEVLEGHVERTNDEITGVTFTQDSFSVSGVAVAELKAANAADNGTDAMTTEYYVYINGVWEKVGTTATGWNNAYDGRDYVSEAQVASILGKYGFKSTGNSARTVFYQPSNADKNSMVWSDTSTVEVGGQRIIPLSGGVGWRLYFAPDSAYKGNAANPADILNKVGGANIKFYSIDVQDPQKFAFQSESEWNAYRVVFRSGSSPTITLPKPSTGTWSFYHDGGEKNKDLKFTDNGNGTMSCKVSGLTQHLRVIPEGTTDFGPDKMTVDYHVYLDGKWQVVGRTLYGWRGNYGLNNMDNMDCRDQISTNQILWILAPYGYNATDGGNARKFAYQQKGQDACYSDTTIDETAGHLMLPLSQNGGGAGYNVYYIPNNTNVIRNVSGGALPATSNRFWSITVSDEYHWCYTPAELEKINSLSAYVPATGERSHFAAAVKEGAKGSVKVRRAGFAWRWHTAEKDANGDPVFPYRETQELNWTVDGDNIIVTTNENMTRQLWLDAYDNSLRMDNAGPQAGDIPTVQGKNEGISFKLFNYRADINEVFYKRGLLKGPTVREELDSPNYFAFRDQESPWKYHTLHSKYDMDGYWFYDDGVPNRTMVEPNLVNGMPVLDMTHRGHVSDPVPNANKSLDILFQGDGAGKQVREYNCANTPLRFDASDGYYKYDSASNAADFSTSSSTWYIRNRVERGQDTAEKYPGYADFLPFNNCEGGQFGTTGNGVPFQYKMLDIDYWFGMTMSVNFFQGKDGKIEHNNAEAPMEFHFSGDDDVWVFLDNMLVLDIGGTHGAVDGCINFHTGLVTTAYNFGPAAGNDPNWAKAGHSSATTIYESFKYALQKQGLSGNALTEKLNEIFISTGETVTDSYTGKSFPVYRFRDYSSHKMNFFYLERGGGSSNCAISFNLPTLPDETLFVGKELEFENSSLTPEQMDFAKQNLTYRFRVVDASGNPIFSNTTAEVLDESFKKVIGTTTLDADGWFTLKAGQRVKFEHMLRVLQELSLEPLEYYVQEAVPKEYMDQYNGVVYKDGGTSGAVNMEGEQGTHWVIYKTGALSPENTYTVIYTNKVDVEQMSLLQIRKEIQNGSVYTGNETFPVVVSIGGTPVASGTKFRYTDNGEMVMAGEGGTVLLKIGRTLQLTAPVLAGTQFAVQENVPEGWLQVGITTTHGTVSNGIASGEVPLDATVLVTITNRTQDFGIQIPLTKEFRGGKQTDSIRTATFRLEQVQDKNGTPMSSGAALWPEEMPADLTISCAGGAVEESHFFLGFKADTPAGIYYYKLTEVGFTTGVNDSFLKDPSEYIAEITVTNGSATLTGLYLNGNKLGNTKPAFVNTFATVELPDCGGTGTTPYIFSGWALALGAAGLMYSKCKKRKGEE